jgi:glutathione synthase
MDPIDDIKYAKDTTLAMLLAAQDRGWPLLYLEQKDVWLRDGVAMGRTRPLTVFAQSRALVRTRRAGARSGSVTLDVLLMRKDPPFDTEYIYTTYILERAECRARWS